MEFSRNFSTGSFLKAMESGLEILVVWSCVSSLKEKIVALDFLYGSLRCPEMPAYRLINGVYSQWIQVTFGTNALLCSVSSHLPAACRIIYSYAYICPGDFLRLAVLCSASDAVMLWCACGLGSPIRGRKHPLAGFFC